MMQLTFKPSKYQEAIYHEVFNGQNNIIVEAKPGSGKTTTIVELCNLLPKRSRILFLAFNKHIADEISSKIKGIADVKTSHSLGRSFLTQLSNKITLDNKKYNNIFKDLIIGNDLIPVKEQYDIAYTLTKLTELVRLTQTSKEDMRKLIRQYDIDLVPELDKYVWQGIGIGLQQFQTSGLIDFADMVYLPSQFNCKPRYYDYVFVDEAQDLNNSQIHLLNLVVGPRTKLVAVGDRRQAIYNFMGANSNCLDIIRERFQAKQMPLSICYRCPKKQVLMASTIESTIEYKPNAEEGVVEVISENLLHKQLVPGDLVLCRFTAPLIDLCIQLIKNRVNARVRGRDIGKQLTSLVKKVSKMPGYSWDNFGISLSQMASYELARLRQIENNEELIESYIDKISAVSACYQSMNATSLQKFVEEIEGLFSDDKPAIWLSTIHRAKGLEENNVYILRCDKLAVYNSRATVEQYEQEVNLAYIAFTRSKQNLYIVPGEKGVSNVVQNALDKISSAS